MPAYYTSFCNSHIRLLFLCFSTTFLYFSHTEIQEWLHTTLLSAAPNYFSSSFLPFFFSFLPMQSSACSAKQQSEYPRSVKLNVLFTHTQINCTIHSCSVKLHTYAVFDYTVKLRTYAVLNCIPRFLCRFPP